MFLLLGSLLSHRLLTKTLHKETRHQTKKQFWLMLPLVAANLSNLSNVVKNITTCSRVFIRTDHNKEILKFDETYFKTVMFCSKVGSIFFALP